MVGGIAGGIIGYNLDRPQIQSISIPFRADNAIIEPKYYPELDQLVAQLLEWPAVEVEIDGHADSRGSVNADKGLAELRAQSVKAYLERHGVIPERISMLTYGIAAPGVDNTSEKGPALNFVVKITPTF